ncbi:hypothetical protein EV673_3178 [Limnobacter thiooxidans]|nr:hypothetical protein EV673_3178 [Limnobacter thiooxidans]
MFKVCAVQQFHRHVTFNPLISVVFKVERTILLAPANVVSRLLIGVQHGGSAPKETTSPCQIDWNSSVKRYAFAFFA